MEVGVLLEQREAENSFILFGTTLFPFATTPLWKAILSAKGEALTLRN
jgi:hypothetical protein